MSKTFIDTSYTESILKELWDQRGVEEFCDIVVVAGEKRIPAHRCILAAASQYFKAALQGNKSNEIQMIDVNGDILRNLIEFFYTGRVVINIATVAPLLDTSKLLVLSNVMSACADFLVEQLSPSNCLGFSQLTELYECETQLQKIREYSLEHFVDIRETNEFLQLSALQLGQLLANDNLTVSSEEVAFDALMKWIQHDQSVREKHQAELLKLVRLPLLDRSFLVERVKPFCTTEECRQIYVEAIESLLSPSDELTKARKPNPKMWTISGTKSVKKDELLMAISISSDNRNLYVNFFCPERRAWLMWQESFKLPAKECWYALIEDNLYIVCDIMENSNVTREFMCLNMRTMCLTKRPQTVSKSKIYGFVALKGILYLIAQYGIEKFCPKTNVWSKVPPMMNPITSSTPYFSIAVLNEKLYIAIDYKPVQCYYPDQNEWRTIGRLPSNFIGNKQMVAANGKLFLTGRYNLLESVACYDPKTDHCKIIDTFPDSFASGLMSSFCNKVIFFNQGRVIEYDEDKDHWIAGTSLKGLQALKYIFSYTNELPDEMNKFIPVPSTQTLEDALGELKSLKDLTVRAKPNLT